MNQLKPIPLTTGRVWIECSECEGRGFFFTTMRVSGEPFDADQCEVECPDCSGTGGWEEDNEPSH